MSERIWKCKIGGEGELPDGADWPMRKAIKAAFKEITGNEDAFCFSGWSAMLTEPERAVVENRGPRAAEAGEDKEGSDDRFEAWWRVGEYDKEGLAASKPIARSAWHFAIAFADRPSSRRPAIIEKDALRAAPSLSREEWGIVRKVIDYYLAVGAEEWTEEWKALRAKVREAWKS